MLGEHTQIVLDEWLRQPARREKVYVPTRTPSAAALSKHGKPFPLSGVRVLDLSWMLASAGAGRFLASMGAEVVKIEHESRLDTMRYNVARVPVGGHAERDQATGPLTTAASWRSMRGSWGCHSI